MLCCDDVTVYLNEKRSFLPMKAMATSSLLSILSVCRPHHLCSLDVNIYIAKSVYLSDNFENIMCAWATHNLKTVFLYNENLVCFSNSCLISSRIEQARTIHTVQDYILNSVVNQLSVLCIHIME